MRQKFRKKRQSGMGSKGIKRAGTNIKPAGDDCAAEENTKIQQKKSRQKMSQENWKKKKRNRIVRKYKRARKMNSQRAKRK